MKTKIMLISTIILSVLLASCSYIPGTNLKVITPSNVNVSENRPVSGFNAINFSTLGKVNIMQGDQESLNISGPDNLVPEISTEVVNGTLVIKNKENITIRPLNTQNPLTFTIVVKDLTSLDVSGLGDVQIETLSTPSMSYKMSGAGKLVQNQLTTEKLNINMSGLGSIQLSGQGNDATIDLSGAGNVDAGDFQLKTAVVNISGLGGATVWVTDSLSGNISGAGSVSYYGNPQTSTQKSGVGDFKSLGAK